MSTVAGVSAAGDLQPIAEPDESTTAREVQPPTFLAVLHLLRCPVDSSNLTWQAQAQRLTCARGVHGYPLVHGIPCLFTPSEWPAGISDVTDIVKAFYEETPFPNYEGLVRGGRVGLNSVSVPIDGFPANDLPR
jgi:uncharacterized protein YbaR (Trm112 family)